MLSSIWLTLPSRADFQRLQTRLKLWSFLPREAELSSQNVLPFLRFRNGSTASYPASLCGRSLANGRLPTTKIRFMTTLFRPDSKSCKEFPL